LKVKTEELVIHNWIALNFSGVFPQFKGCCYRSHLDICYVDLCNFLSEFLDILIEIQIYLCFHVGKRENFQK
jgi:hypothetical protein